MTFLLTELDAVAAALDRAGLAYESHGQQLRAACPVCGRTGRRGRRPVLIHRRATGGLGTEATCGCQVCDIAVALDLPPNALLAPKVEVLPPSTLNRFSGTNRSNSWPPAYAKPWGGSRIQTQARSIRRGNLRGVERVAGDLDRLFAQRAPGEWQSYDTRRAAKELRMDRKSVRLALRWLVQHNILDVRPTPAPGEKVKTARGKQTAKSGVKQYRPLTERQQIERISRRAPRP